MSKHHLPTRKLIKVVAAPIVHPISFSKDTTQRLVESVRTVRATHHHLKDFQREAADINLRSEVAANRFFDDNREYFEVFAEALANAKDTAIKNPEVWLASNRLRLKQLIIDLFSLQVARKYRDQFMWDGDHYYAGKLQKEIDKLEEPTNKAVETFRRYDYPIDGFLKQHGFE